VIETITILIYSIVFYRYWSKRRLRKSMDIRDRARSDLYLAQLRSQSAPNTPGFGPMSPSYSMHSPRFPGSPRFPTASYSANKGFDHANEMEEGYMQPGTRFVEAKPSSPAQSKPFALQPPPIRIHAATPRQNQDAFDTPTEFQERRIEHAPAAEGEQTYEQVAIPGSYTSPAHAPQHFGSFPTQTVSPPASPRYN
jgi:hypothetical protein